MCGHFLRPAFSTKALVLIEIPIPHVAVHGDHSDHGVVRQTPRPSPAPLTDADTEPKFSSGSPSSSELI